MLVVNVGPKGKEHFHRPLHLTTHPISQPRQPEPHLPIPKGFHMLFFIGARDLADADDR